jgi:hypothetical protein
VRGWTTCLTRLSGRGGNFFFGLGILEGNRWDPPPALRVTLIFYYLYLYFLLLLLNNLFKFLLNNSQLTWILQQPIRLVKFSDFNYYIK